MSAASAFPLRAGLAVAEVVRSEFGLAPAIKWPNDVVIGGRKIAGVLCELRGAELVVGIGINANQRRFTFDSRQERSRAPTSLILETGRRARLRRLLVALLREIDRWLTGDGGQWRAKVNEILLWRGQDCEITDALQRQVRGFLYGVCDDGTVDLGGQRFTTGTLRGPP